jgi:hypothetical protein
LSQLARSLLTGGYKVAYETINFFGQVMFNKVLTLMWEILVKQVVRILFFSDDSAPNFPLLGPKNIIYALHYANIMQMFFDFPLLII